MVLIVPFPFTLWTSMNLFQLCKFVWSKSVFYGNGYIHTQSYTKVEILICYQEGILIYFVVYHFGFVSIIFWNLEVGELSAMLFAGKMDCICAYSQCEAVQYSVLFGLYVNIQLETILIICFDAYLTSSYLK